MNNKEEHIKDLAQIRSMMEKSSRFISLSGLSGIFAGFFALIGAVIAFFYLDYDQRYMDIRSYQQVIYQRDYSESVQTLFLIAVVVLILALSSGIFFTTRRAKKNNLPIWDRTTKLLLTHVSIPLVAGGLFCMILLYQHIYHLIAPSTLLFYGLALLNGSKYTLSDVQYLGITEIILGLVSAFIAGFGLISWALGFGVLHIVYGTVMYFKYERRGSNSKYDVSS